ncbi:hypothetical protein pneo_cds_158 [Pandoravirus neocaledonia]|uniref:Uncharacterized protein n=1 Tax=Pandoravirus neocaledonia TaxID=2107708 RepID=A0A2U7UBN2_9VIRU|nr:hypothetical protein pneo_cds_158 [Pandoravirus neocaledonia]AVK75765.1 hypothetical protein pneo_cds_158 [Pandoravirus neocaledonia]
MGTAGCTAMRKEAGSTERKPDACTLTAVSASVHYSNARVLFSLLATRSFAAAAARPLRTYTRASTQLLDKSLPGVLLLAVLMSFVYGASPFGVAPVIHHYGVVATPTVAVAAPVSYGVAAPAFGAVAAPVSYGVAAPAFGAVAAPVSYGVAAPAFGVAAPAFGAVAAPAFGVATPAFGVAAPAFGAVAAPVFGASRFCC